MLLCRHNKQKKDLKLYMNEIIKDALLKALPLTVATIGGCFITLMPLYLILKLQSNQSHANELTRPLALPLVQRNRSTTPHL